MVDKEKFIKNKEDEFLEAMLSLEAEEQGLHEAKGL